MSLIRQLWLAVVIVSMLAFIASFAVSTFTARDYVEKQLRRQNIDAANSLALSMSQQVKDAATVELQVAALFDGGHYHSVAISDPFGKTIVDRIQTRSDVDVPGWLMKALPIASPPARAQVTDGWKQFGIVTIVSDSRFAYQALWNALMQLGAWFLVAMLASGFVGTMLIRGIRRPLDAVVAQAHAIAERRFIEIDEPRTPELRSMVRAMNDMVARVRQMFADEGARLATLRHKVNHDDVTGLSNRDYFMAHLRDVLADETAASGGSLVLVRLLDLQEINARLGRSDADALLKDVGAALYKSGEGRVGQRAGRLKGAEFAVLCPTFESANAAAGEIAGILAHEVLPKWSDRVPELFHVAATSYSRGVNARDLMIRADEALAAAAGKGPNAWHAEQGAPRRAALPAEEWRGVLTDAVSAGNIQLAFYPVVGAPGSLLHEESAARLKVDEGPLLSAGDFMPMAARLNLVAPLDLGVVQLAIRHLQSVPGAVAVNLSAETLAHWGFRNDFRTLLKQHAGVASRLWFEVPEYGVFRHFEAFQELCKMLKALGCRVGIEHFGHRFSEAHLLAGLGLDYVKVHATFIRGIDTNTGNQEFLRGMCAALHGFGIVVIAVGVETEAEFAKLRELGFDGATGPGVSP